MKKKLFTLMTLLQCLCSGAWAEDFTITPLNGSYLSPGNIAKITYTGDLSTSSGRIVANASKSGTFTITTNAPDMYIKSVTFTDENNGNASKKATISKTAGGGTLSSENGVYTYTGADGDGDLTISAAAGTGGQMKLKDVSIVVSNGNANSMITMTTFAKSGDAITASSVTCNAAAVSSPITMWSSTWTIDSNNIKAQSSNNSKTITISSVSGRHLKYIAFYDSNCRLGVTETSSTGGATDGASWTAADDETTSVTFKNAISTSLTITKIFVITEADALAPTITTQPASANYYTPQSASALSVEATTSGGTLYYQWFKNTSKTTEGATSVQEKSSADGANSYTPTWESAGTYYYYCAVTDDNGTKNSSFATITVTDPSAPVLSLAKTTDVPAWGYMTVNSDIAASIVGGGSTVAATIKKGDDVIAELTGTLDGTGKKLTFRNTTALEYSTGYTFNIAANVLANSTYADYKNIAYSLDFTTGAKVNDVTLTNFTAVNTFTSSPSTSDISFTVSGCQYGQTGHSGEIKFRWAYDDGKASTLKISSSAHNIVAIALTYTNDGVEPVISANSGTYNTSSKMWTGNASSVTFSNSTNTSSGNAYISEMVVYYEGTEDIPYVEITPSYNKTTYVTTKKLDFSGVDGLKAYVATGSGTGTVTMTSVGAVPEATPLMLVGTASTTYNVPVAASATAPATNYLKAGPVTFDGTEDDKYILYTDGIFYLTGAGSLSGDKAYLDLAGLGARQLSVVFEDNTATAINGIEEVAPVTKTRKVVKNGRLVIETANGEFTIDGARVK